MKLTKSFLQELIREEIKKVLLEQGERCRIPRMPSTFSSSNYMTDDKKREIPIKIWPEIGTGAAGAKGKPQAVWGIFDAKTGMWLETMTMGGFVTWLSKHGCHRPKNRRIGRLYGPTHSRRLPFLWSDVSDYFDPETEEDKYEELDRDEDIEEFEPMVVDDEGPPGPPNVEGGCGPRPPIGADWKSRPATDPRRIAFRKWLDCRKGRRAP